MLCSYEEYIKDEAWCVLHLIRKQRLYFLNKTVTNRRQLKPSWDPAIIKAKLLINTKELRFYSLFTKYKT